MEKSLKSKIISITLAILILLSGISLLFFAPKVELYRAEGENSGIRFKQVALGEDFAIALTYDGELYGWDLGSAHTNKLGLSYGVNPRKIEFSFANGGDSIIKVAVTKSNAAFITAKNRIYTWGSTGGYTHDNISMLLRDDSGAQTPTPIRTDYTGVNTLFVGLMQPGVFPDKISGLPSNITNANHGALVSDDNSLLDIVGSDNTFVVKHKRTANNNSTFYFAWGSGEYMATPLDDQNALATGLFSFNHGGQNSALAVGGGTIVVSNNNELFVRGKNFYIPKNADDKEYKIGKTNKVTEQGGEDRDILYLNTVFDLKPETENTPDAGYDPYTIVPLALNLPASIDGTAVGSPGVAINEALANNGATGSQYEFFRVARTNPTLRDGDADLLVATAGTDPIYIEQSSLSMGNGYGYIINDSNLYFFGNGFDGQSGNGVKRAYNSIEAVSLSGINGTPLDVAAGKTAMGTKIYDSLSAATALPGGGVLELTKKEGEDKTVTVKGLNAYADGDDYLSGLLTTSDVYVWNKDFGFASLNDKFAEYGVNTTVDPTNKIVKLYPGYGGYMVALSSYGKVFEIRCTTSGESGVTTPENITVNLKDNFVNANGTAITNYAVATGNRLDFALSNGRPSNSSETQKESLSALITLVGNTASDGLMAETSKYENIIQSNNVGDVYRILTDADDNLRDRAIIKNANDPTDGSLRFYFKGRESEGEIKPEILAHYLKKEFVNTSRGDTSDIGIRITPYQSTRGETIVMRYYVARCASDTLKSMSIGPLNESSTAVASEYKFYDYKEVSVEITIANTKANFTEFVNFLSGEQPNVSVPLLDINNKNNNEYSIALTNVQYGLSMLAGYYGLTGDALAAFDRAVIGLAYEADHGFPAKQRIDDAHLERYFVSRAEAERYYTDRYQYFMSDPDGDVLSFVTNELSGSNSYYTAAVAEIELIIPLTPEDGSYVLSIGNLSYFNNIYGMTLELVDDNTRLSVKYSVLRLTAKKAMESARLHFDDDDFRKPAMYGSLDDMTCYTVALSEQFIDTAGEGENTNSPDERAQHRVPAFVQATMVTDDGANRSEKGYNERRIAPITLTAGASAERVYTYELRQRGLFADYTNIYLTAKVEDKYSEWEDFVDQFDPTLAKVTLDAEKFTFEGFEAGVYNDIRIAIRRFRDETRSAALKDAAGEDAEVIILIFDITVQGSSFPNSDLVTYAPGTISGTLTVPINEFTKASNVTFGKTTGDTAQYCTSTNPHVATVTVSSDRKSLIIEPVASGETLINFYIFQYDIYAKSSSFKVSVAGRSIMTDRVMLMDTETLYLADFKAAIAQTVNGFEFSEYSLDKSDLENAPNGYYFVQENSETGKYEPVAQPEFIQSVGISKDNSGNDNALIVSIIDGYSGSSVYKSTMLVTKFANAEGNGKYESAVIIEPARQRVLNENSESVVIEVRKTAKQVQAIEGQGGSVSTDGQGYVLPISVLYGYIKNINNIGSYSLQLVAPTTDRAYEYFDISRDGNSILITPHHNTPETFTINVVISSTDENARRILLFDVNVTGIVETLERNQYIMIWVIVAACVLFVLLIVFIIRMGFYWKKKAAQKRIIRKNQMLIKMRDKVHGKGDSVKKEQLVQTKLKLEDPKYAKMFNEMKKEAEESKITIEDAPKKGKKNKKKNGKKSLDELKAELAAKREEFNKMQMDGMNDVSMPVEDIPVDPASFGTFEGVVPDDMNNNVGSDENILFDVETLDDNK